MRLAIQPSNAAPLAVAWEECACLLCGGERHTPVLEAADPVTHLQFLIVRCDHCGLSFTNPRPDAVSIAPFYPSDYRCHQTKNATNKIDPLSRFLPLHGLARLLDFGCGSGDFLTRMQSLGWTGTGIDASETAVACVRARGHVAHVGTLPHDDLISECFEAIVMRQSLEHTHQPLDVLQAALGHLTCGGRLIVAVPNFDSFAANWFGADWHGLDLPRHLAHFTSASLRLMLQRTGFKNVELHQQIRTSWIRHSAELRRRRGEAGFGSRLLQTRIGSSVVGGWGRLCERADCLIAVAAKS